MKKFLLAALAIIMVLSMFACTNNENNGDVNGNENNNEQSGVSKSELAANASVEAIAQALMNKYAEYTGMRASYDEYMAEMPAEDQIPYEEFLSYQLSVMPVEAGAEWLQGFSEVPAGYAEAYCYQPMMMGQAFIGYVFRVAEGTDVEAFKAALTSTCDPRWNICTMANTTVCENYENLVYFSMMVVADEENPFGFTAEQKDGFYNTFVSAIENPAE